MREIVEGLVTGTLAFIYSIFSERKARSLKKRILCARLLKDGYEWRSTKRLARSIGQSKEATRELLLEMEATHSMGDKDLWKLAR